MDFICIILDVGNHMFDSDTSVNSLTNGVNAVKRLIQKKLFSESKDEMSLILCGSHKTRNKLNDNSINDYKHIEMIRMLNKPDWNFFEDLSEQSQCYGSEEGDLIEAITVAADHLVTQLRGRKVKGIKRILVFSNLERNINFLHFTKITEALSKEEIELNVISDREFSKENDNNTDKPSTSDGRLISQFGTKVSETKLTNEDKLSMMVSKLNGVSYSFEDVLLSLDFYETKSVKQTGWKVNLDISNVCHISVVGYIKVKQVTPHTLKLRYGGDISAEIERRTTYHLNDANSTIVDIADTIKGFKYGKSLIPFTENDIESMKLSVERGLKLIGFCAEDDVSRHLWIGDCSMIFVAKDIINDSVFTSLVHAMFESHVVAIVRRVYSSSSSPRLALLSPLIKKKSACLVYCEIAYGEDIRSYIFPSLPYQVANDVVLKSSNKKKPTLVSDSQLKAVDCLIESLMLVNKDTENDNETEVFKPSTIVSPYFQMFYQSASQRYFHPNEGLKDLDERVMGTLHPPEENQELLSNCINVVKELFLLKNKEHNTKKKKRLIDTFSEDNRSSKKIRIERYGDHPLSLGDIARPHVSEVSCSKPIEDFQNMLSQGDLFAAINSMQARIWEFINESYMSTLYPKALQCLHELRRQVLEHSKKDDTLVTTFNKFLQDMKESLLLSPSQIIFWNLLKKEKIFLIGSSESDLGCTDSQNELFSSKEDFDDLDELKEEEMDTLFEDM